ncbi:hypothetical protein GEV33_000466 [Tenebrio molitor]|uniref:Ig-like domain-containing protein n=1 Tax=Tenebrio molitor TaxID=7067 RepID=A0A8J6HP57_TENMO|nr:hypothetical protein GEV33_000466 [Tenebrio molitor]
MWRRDAGAAYQPEFAEPIVNLTIPMGRDATFRCLVHHLGGYRRSRAIGSSPFLNNDNNGGVRAHSGQYRCHPGRMGLVPDRLGRASVPHQMSGLMKSSATARSSTDVGWVKADTKAIQAIHDHVITHNPRVSVSHNDHSTWNLHIKNVQEEDRGQYMCQINTDPMKSQLGYLDVVVPPDFISEETSGDVMVPEGGTVKLTCRARGHPEPHVQWRREDGSDIVIREPSGLRTRVSSYQGEVLLLVKISRSEMGAYMCIASNGVPPTVSKRIMVNVNCG